jgi:hypothetical protein
MALFIYLAFVFCSVLPGFAHISAFSFPPTNHRPTPTIINNYFNQSTNQQPTTKSQAIDHSFNTAY